MKSVEEIVEPYKDRLSKIDYKNIKNAFNVDVCLFQKYAWRVKKNYYGFSLGNVPMVWGNIIDDFLEELSKEVPDFKILQVKVKYGKLRAYVSLGETDITQEQNNQIKEQIRKLEDLLFSKDLIY